MNDSFDQEQLDCPTCKHRWILMSNRGITNEQRLEWLRKIVEHHKKIQEAKE